MNVKRIAAMCLIISISFTVGAFAASNIEKVEAFLRRDYQVFLDGKKADVGTVLVYKGSSYLPVSKMGQLLGVDIHWKAENKGIYVNSRFPGQPQNIDTSLDYDQITMFQPQGYMAAYLGGEFPVLSITTSDYKKYYRDRDIQRMGIDTRGLRKAQENTTKELYITETEISKVWKEKPVFTYVYDKLVIGESDTDKLKVLQNFVNGLPAMYELLNKNNPDYYYYTVPYVYVIDAIGNDEYHLLTLETNEYKQYWVKLKKNHMDQWYQAEYEIINVGTSLPQY